VVEFRRLVIFSYIKERPLKKRIDRGRPYYSKQIINVRLALKTFY